MADADKKGLITLLWAGGSGQKRSNSYVYLLRIYSIRVIIVRISELDYTKKSIQTI